MATTGSASFFLQLFCTDPICLSINATDDETILTLTENSEETCNDVTKREEKETLGYVGLRGVRRS